MGSKRWKGIHCYKNLLPSNSVLTPFNKLRLLTLICNTSPYGIGTVLSHFMLDMWREAPVAYFSRTLLFTKCNYVQINKEAFAIVAVVKEFHDYVYGWHFEIITDHKLLMGLFLPSFTDHVTSDDALVCHPISVWVATPMPSAACPCWPQSLTCLLLMASCCHSSPQMWLPIWWKTALCPGFWIVYRGGGQRAVQM